MKLWKSAGLLRFFLRLLQLSKIKARCDLLSDFPKSVSFLHSTAFCPFSSYLGVLELFQHCDNSLAGTDIPGVPQLLFGSTKPATHF